MCHIICICVLCALGSVFGVIVVILSSLMKILKILNPANQSCASGSLPKDQPVGRFIETLCSSMHYGLK